MKRGSKRTPKTSFCMDAAVGRSIRAAVTDGQGQHLRHSEAVTEGHYRKCQRRAWCLLWHLSAVSGMLLMGWTLTLIHVDIKIAHAAESSTPNAGERRSAGARAPDESPTDISSTLTPTFTEDTFEPRWTGLRPTWSGTPASLGILSSSGHTPSALYMSDDKPATSTARHSWGRGGDFSAGVNQAGADSHHISRVQKGTANHEEHERDRDLRALCAELDVDCAWVESLLMKYFRHGVDPWNPAMRARLRIALGKGAQLVHEEESQGAAGAALASREARRQRLRAGAPAVPVEQPLLDPRKDGLVPTEERAQSGAAAPEAKDVDTQGEATGRRRASSYARPVVSRHVASAHSDERKISDVLRLLDERSGLQDGNNRSQRSVNLTYEDTGGVQQVYNEVIDSLKQNRELQHLLGLPLIRDVSESEADEDEGQINNKENAETHPRLSSAQTEEQVPENGSRSHEVPEAAEASSANANDEVKAGSSTRAATEGDNGTPAKQRPQSLLLRPHLTAQFVTRPAENPATWGEMHTVGRLNVGQLEGLLLSRREQQRRSPHTPRSLVFPSCYFNAPLQKRMREKAALLLTALEQLTDAIEALTELGEVVEKQTDATERAASTLLYRVTAAEEATPTVKLLGGELQDHGISENRKQPVGDEGEKVAEPLARKRGYEAGAENSKHGFYRGRSRTFKERNVSPADGSAAEATAVTVVQPKPLDQTNDETYSKLVGRAGVRIQLRELIAAWELARRAAAAAKTANEVMRRAETLRRNLVLPLQQDVQHLSLLEATLNPRHVARQRLSGCKGFIKAVRRTISRAEEDLYHLGAHAFASEASLPLMAHDLQKYLAGLLKYVVKAQQHHYHALNESAATLKALHRVFYRRSKELQQEAARKLKSSHHLLATPEEEWQELAQHLGNTLFQLRVDFARQLVEVKNLKKKMNRFEDICSLLKAGLRHLLRVQLRLQHIRKKSTHKQDWLWLTIEAMGGVAQMRTEADSDPEEEPMQMHEPVEKESDELEAKPQGDRYGVVQKGDSLLRKPSYEDIAQVSLESPLQARGTHADAWVASEHEEEVLEKEEETSMRFLQRLLSKVDRMGEVLHMCKTQSNEAEQLLRHGFDAAQESVKKVTTVAQTLTAHPVTMDPRYREQKIRDNIPLLARSIQRQEVARAKIKAAVEESAAQLERLGRQVRYISAALASTEDSPIEQHPASAREIIARIDRINSHLFTDTKHHARRRRHSFEVLQAGEEDSEGGAEAPFEEAAGSGYGGNVIDHGTPAGREYLDSQLVSALESVEEAQYNYAQKRQALETLEAGLRESRIALEVNLRILAEVRELARFKLSSFAIRNASRQEDGDSSADVGPSTVLTKAELRAVWSRQKPQTDEFFGAGKETTGAAKRRNDKKSGARESKHERDAGQKTKVTEASDRHRIIYIRRIPIAKSSAHAKLGKTDAENWSVDLPGGKPATKVEADGGTAAQNANGLRVLVSSGLEASTQGTNAQRAARQAETAPSAAQKGDDEEEGKEDEDEQAEEDDAEEEDQSEEEELAEGEHVIYQSESHDEEADAHRRR